MDDLRLSDRAEQGFDDLGVPESLRPGIRRWILQGILPGGFLRAVFSNSLTEAAVRADLDNRRALGAVGCWVYQYAPRACRGDAEQQGAWQRFHWEQRAEKTS